MKVSKIMIYLLILTVVGLYSNAIAQEHPTEHPTKKKVEKTTNEHPTEHPTEHPAEHPQKAEKQEHPAQEKMAEHPEHPEKHEKAHLTIEEFADAVEHYIAEQEKNSDGFFVVQDKEHNKTLKCKLVKIHKERLASLGDNEFFVCADFKADDGNVYDIDIFMQGSSKDNLKATRTMVHKDNGNPRYTWYEEDGVWKTKKVENK